MSEPFGPAGEDFEPGRDGALRDAIDRRLEELIGLQREQLPEAGRLLDAIAGVIAAGGKRLRPSFCYWGYRAAGGPSGAEIVTAAAALELLHTFAIVHDDIMDESSERRGRPTLHAEAGVPFALLAGDLALVLADDAFIGSGFPSDAVLRGFVYYSRMRREVIAGQALELEISRAPKPKEKDVQRVAVLKSGRYSVVEPLRIGAALAGADEALINSLACFGAPLGEAFQWRDDLLGIFGDPAETGKPADSDIRQGKRNLLYVKTVAALSGDDRRFFLGRWGGTDLTSEELERLRDLVTASGARRAVEHACEELLERARSELAGMPISEPARGPLLALAEQAAGARTR